MKISVVALISVVWGLGSGVIIATGVLAFITAIGIIPRFAAKTNTKSYYLTYETAAVLGIIVGSIFTLFEIQVPIPKLMIGAIGLFMGIFTGCLSVAVAEILNILPIMKNRLKLKKSMRIVLLAFAIGKMIGSLYYWFYPGFNM